MTSLVERYQEKIAGALSCLDRVVIQGTLPGLCYADGMTAYLNTAHIRIFDYPQFASPLRDLIRDNAEWLAAENGLKIEFVRNPNPAEPEPNRVAVAVFGRLHRERLALGG